ncbi:hypothetical protein D9M68_1003620 [compost metagenome]
MIGRYHHYIPPFEGIQPLHFIFRQQKVLFIFFYFDDLIGIIPEKRVIKEDIFGDQRFTGAG